MPEATSYRPATGSGSSLAPVLHRTDPAGFLVLLTLLLMLGTTARAETRPVLNLNLSPNGYPPYLMFDESGNPGGLAFDTVSRIAGKLGYQITVHQIPRKRADSFLLDGRIDATLRAREWAKEAKKFLFTDAIIDIQEVFFTRSDFTLEFSGLSDLPAMHVVTPLGYYYPELDDLFNRGHLQRFEVPHDHDIFMYLLHNPGFDAVIADLTVGQWIIRQNNWKQYFRHSRNHISRYGYRVMLRPDWTEFAEAFNQELSLMKASGELEEIFDNYR